MLRIEVTWENERASPIASVMKMSSQISFAFGFRVRADHGGLQGALYVDRKWASVAV